jgi:hypothetical protein
VARSVPVCGLCLPEIRLCQAPVLVMPSIRSANGGRVGGRGGAGAGGAAVEAAGGVRRAQDPQGQVQGEPGVSMLSTWASIVTEIYLCHACFLSGPLL